MLEYVKTILLKVSFDSVLFEKELRKAFRFVNSGEVLQLKQWCYENFSEPYLSILNSAFAKVWEPARQEHARSISQRH